MTARRGAGLYSQAHAQMMPVTCAAFQLPQSASPRHLIAMLMELNEAPAGRVHSRVLSRHSVNLPEPGHRLKKVRTDEVSFTYV